MTLPVKTKYMLWLSLLALVTVLGACGSDATADAQEERTSVEETLVDLTFDLNKNVLLPSDETYTVTTDKQTMVWDGMFVDLVESEDGTNKVTYETNGDGRIDKQTIHLNPDGLKAYSKTYAEVFEATMTLEKK